MLPPGMGWGLGGGAPGGPSIPFCSRKDLIEPQILLAGARSGVDPLSVGVPPEPRPAQNPVGKPSFPLRSRSALPALPGTEGSP